MPLCTFASSPAMVVWPSLTCQLSTCICDPLFCLATTRCCILHFHFFVPFVPPIDLLFSTFHLFFASTCSPVLFHHPLVPTTMARPSLSFTSATSTLPCLTNSLVPYCSFHCLLLLFFTVFLTFLSTASALDASIYPRPGEIPSTTSLLASAWLNELSPPLPLFPPPNAITPSAPPTLTPQSVTGHVPTVPSRTL